MPSSFSMEPLGIIESARVYPTRGDGRHDLIRRSRVVLTCADGTV